MLTVERLRELLDFNPETGELCWRIAPRHQRIEPGQSAGYVGRRGYLRIRIDGAAHQAHRLAWMHHHGTPPLGDIDHIDGDRLNNRIANLRDVSKFTNQQNQVNRRFVGATGLTGVTRQRNKFEARISANGVSHHLGMFETAEAAHLAYLGAKKRLHFGDSRFSAVVQAGPAAALELDNFCPPRSATS